MCPLRPGGIPERDIDVEIHRHADLHRGYLRKKPVILISAGCDRDCWPSYNDLGSAGLRLKRQAQVVMRCIESSIRCIGRRSIGAVVQVSSDII